MTYLLEYGKLDPDSEWNNPPNLNNKGHKMAIINEKDLKKDTRDCLMQYHGVTKKEAKAICTDEYMEKIMEAMFDAQTHFVVETKVATPVEALNAQVTE